MNIIKKNTGRLIFILSLLYFVSIQLLSINPIEQDRFFYFSLEMIKRGPSFFPYVHGAPYPDYIAFVMIMSDAVSRVLGHVSVLSVGLPYCIAAPSRHLHLSTGYITQSASWMHGRLFLFVNVEIARCGERLRPGYFSCLSHRHLYLSRS